MNLGAMLQRGLSVGVALVVGCGGSTAPTSSPRGAAGSRPRLSPSSSSAAMKSVLRLDFLRDVGGWLMPCGCSPNQRGGLHFLGALLAESPPSPRPRWLLEAGPLFYGTSTLTCQAADQKRLKAKTMADAMATLGLQAWAPGREDFADGRGALGALVERSHAQPLSGGALRILTTSGPISVGLFGITSPKLDPSTSAKASLDDQYAAVAAQIAASPRDGTRLWVALSATGRDEARRLAERVPELAIVAVGSEQNPPAGEGGAPPELHHRTWLIEPENHGQSLVSLELFLTEGARLPLDGALALVTYPSPPTGTTPTVQYRSTSIEPVLGTDPTLQAMIQSYTDAVQVQNQEAFVERLPIAPLPGAATFVGALACASCHDREYRHWMATKHASAYDTLTTKKRDRDLECVGCHVTGYELPGGSTVTHVGALPGIQCELCHGPASLHAQKPFVPGKTLLKHEPVWCIDSCHRPPHVVNFDAKSKLDVVMKEGHGISPAVSP
jgi:hypothetical protein